MPRDVSNGGSIHRDLTRVRLALGPRVPAKYASYGERVRNETLNAVDRIQERYAELERDRDAWAKVAREYEAALGDRGLL